MGGSGVSTPLDFSVFSFWVRESVLHWTSPFSLSGFGSQYSTGLLRFFLSGFGGQYSTGLLRFLFLGSGVSTPQDFSVFSFCSPVFTMASEWKFNFRLFGPNV